MTCYIHIALCDQQTQYKLNRSKYGCVCAETTEPKLRGFHLQNPAEVLQQFKPSQSQLQPGSCSSAPLFFLSIPVPVYTLLPPSPTRHLKNTTIIPALLCLHTCFVCIRFFPLFVNLPPLENLIESGWRVWLDTGFAAAARWLWIMRWWKYSPTLNTRQYFCINYMSAQNMPRVLFNIYNLTCFECEANQSICCWKFTIL